MRQFLANSLFGIAVRARKSPWIETTSFRISLLLSRSGLVRARGLKLVSGVAKSVGAMSGLVRARGLKQIIATWRTLAYVRARKSPWIETYTIIGTVSRNGQGS